MIRSLSVALPVLLQCVSCGGGGIDYGAALNVTELRAFEAR
jgi:hypothetical protein